jgi:hypothetical protein
MPIFFLSLYFGLLVEYYLSIYPLLDAEFPHPRAMKLVSFIVTPWPLVLFVALQLADPGEIVSTNVLSYLDRYPADGCLYTDCFHEGSPIVPRSRFCGRTHRWIAKYDHYCPWVAQPIGERTCRVFLLFLVCCLAISAVGLIGFSMFFWRRIEMYPNLTAWRVYRFASVVAIDHVVELLGWSLTVGLTATLFFFLGLLAVQCSRNETTIERSQKRAWKKRNPGKRFVNAYDRGFVANWSSVLFPERVVTHAPFREQGQ